MSEYCSRGVSLLSIVFWMNLFVSEAAGATEHHVTNCTHSVVSLNCPVTSVITVTSATHGFAQHCDYTGQECTIEDKSLHECTGRQQCSILASQLYIPNCGASSFMSLLYNCVPRSSIKDICTLSEKHGTETGYLATPGYPAPMPVPHGLLCTAQITVLQGQRINLFLVDFRQVKVTRYCLLKVIISESAPGSIQSQIAHRRTVCADGVRGHSEALYVSSNYTVWVTIEAPQYTYQHQDKVILLLHYKGFTSGYHNNQTKAHHHTQSVTDESRRDGGNKDNKDQRKDTPTISHKTIVALCVPLISAIAIIAILTTTFFILRNHGSKRCCYDNQSGGGGEEPRATDESMDDAVSFSSWSTSCSINSQARKQPADYQNMSYIEDRPDKYSNGTVFAYEETYMQPVIVKHDRNSDSMSNKQEENGTSKRNEAGQKAKGEWSVVNGVIYDEPCPAHPQLAEQHKNRVREHIKMAQRPTEPPPNKPQPRSRTGRKPMPPPKPVMPENPGDKIKAWCNREEADDRTVTTVIDNDIYENIDE